MSQQPLQLIQGENRLFGVDFSQFPEISSGGLTLSSASAACSPAGLTLGTPAISGNLVWVRTTGGTAGTNYTLIVTATLSDGLSVLIGEASVPVTT